MTRAGENSPEPRTVLSGVTNPTGAGRAVLKPRPANTIASRKGVPHVVVCIAADNLSHNTHCPVRTDGTLWVGSKVGVVKPVPAHALGR